MDMLYCVFPKTKALFWHWVHTEILESVLKAPHPVRRINIAALLFKWWGRGTDREPGCLSRPTLTREETLGTCRNSSPYRSTSHRERKVVRNMLNRNGKEKRGLSRSPSLPMGIFIRHSQGYNRGLFNYVFGIVEWKCLSEPCGDVTGIAAGSVTWNSPLPAGA